MSTPRTSRSALLLVALLLAGVGCSAEEPPSPDPVRAADVEDFGHVHGLEVNPGDGLLYVASHTGVFRQTDDGFERVSDRRQDTMAFTIVGPDHFLASGHPGPGEDKPGNLGLIESTDAAESWQVLSLEGEADFHELEPAGDRLYGLDSTTGQLLVTEDRASWRTLGQVPALSMAADPTTPGSLLLTDSRGEVVRMGPDSRPELVGDAPTMTLLDWPAPDLLVGMGPSGEVHRSSDGGDSWEPVTPLEGRPLALSVTPERWYAATSTGLFRSEDEGSSWTEVPAGG